MDSFVEKWVVPFYGSGPRRCDADEMLQALSEVQPEIVERLLSEEDGSWRERQVAGWFVGLKKWSQFRERIAELLIESRLVYAGQGYCFALACLADMESSRHLEAYLDCYLRQPELYYDQHWAMPALMWIDERNGTSYSAEFIKPGGLWETFVADKIYWQLPKVRGDFWELMEYCRQHFGTDEAAKV